MASRVEHAAKGLGAGLLVTDQALAAAAGPADGAAAAWVPVCAVHTYDVALAGKSERFTLVEVVTELQGTGALTGEDVPIMAPGTVHSGSMRPPVLPSPRGSVSR